MIYVLRCILKCGYMELLMYRKFVSHLTCPLANTCRICTCHISSIVSQHRLHRIVEFWPSGNAFINVNWGSTNKEHCIQVSAIPHTSGLKAYVHMYLPNFCHTHSVLKVVLVVQQKLKLTLQIV